jgi:ABC-type multidrug transport system ATPase subunit
MVANLSYGQQKKLALMRVFLNDSDLLVLDEPCVGLDKNSKDTLCSFLRDQKEDKKALIFSSHLSLDIDSEFINLDKVTS